MDGENRERIGGHARRSPPNAAVKTLLPRVGEKGFRGALVRGLMGLRISRRMRTTLTPISTATLEKAFETPPLPNSSPQGGRAWGMPASGSMVSRRLRAVRARNHGAPALSRKEKRWRP